MGLFVLDLWANTCQTHHVTSRPWPLTLEVMALVGDTGLLRAPHVYRVWSTYALPFGRYDALSVSTLVGLVTLTFDVWHWNWCALLHNGCATFLLIVMFLRRFILDLWTNTCQTYRLPRDLATLTFVRGLRLVSHCGTHVNAFGRHGFLCKKAPHRSIRHHALNELVGYSSRCFRCSNI